MSFHRKLHQGDFSLKGRSSLVNLALQLLRKETLPPSLGGEERFPFPVLTETIRPIAEGILGLFPYFKTWVWGEEGCLHHEVTGCTALRLPQHDVSRHGLLASRMLTTMQVTISPEDRLALRGLAGYLQKKIKLVDGLMRIKESG